MTSTCENRINLDAGNADAATDGGDLIDQTIAIWHKRSRRQLTREDGREIIENVTGFFRVLQDWDRAERSTRKAPKTGS